MQTTTIETADAASDKARQSTMLSPRFYTTDFKAMDRLDISSMRTQWDTMMAEYEGDNNHDHFQRTPEFAKEVAERFSQVSPAMRQEFLDFLISSLTSEFSGCILYNEIFKKNKRITGRMIHILRIIHCNDLIQLQELI